TDEARALAVDPLNFLHVSRVEIDLPAGTDPHSDEVYQKAAARYRQLKRDAAFVRDDQPTLYLYRLHADGHSQTGVAAAYSLDEYDRDIIKKHERTRRDKEDDRTRHIVELRAQTGPVFLTYKATGALDHLLRAITADAPLYDFRADDGVQHTIWRVAAREANEVVDAFGAIP